MTHLPRVPTIPAGTELDGFVIEGVAGLGGMGVVYRARQRQPERVVALKVIAAGLADDPMFAARFRRESAIAAQIEHPNVIPVHAVGEADGILYIAMRFVDGTDLRRLLRQDGRLGQRRAATVIDQVGQALDAAHAQGLVHRDVKPANILISTIGGRDHVYLSDFGISRHIEGSHALTGSGEFLGTTDYVAPEQVRGDRVDARTDVYSLGCVLFEALSGTVPFALDSDLAKLYAHDSKPPPSIIERAPDVAPEFEPVLQCAMAKSPDDRYPSAGDLGRAAIAAAYGQSFPGMEGSVAVGAAAPDGPAARTRPAATVARLGASTSVPPTRVADTSAAGTGSTATPRRRRRAAAGAFLLVLAATAGIVLALTGGNHHPPTRHPTKVSARATTLRVPSGRYPTIQAAIRAARPGETIDVGGGTFSGQVTIGKNLALTGAGMGSTTLKAPSSLTPGPLGGLRSIVTIMGGARVTISRLRIAGPATGGCNSSSSVDAGILVAQGSTLELHSAAVTDIRDHPVECATADQRAVLIGLAPGSGQPTTGQATIADDLITGYGDEGIDVAGSGSKATITGNTISGAGGAPGQFVGGIVVEQGATAEIMDNTVTANHCTSPALAAADRGGRACGPDPLNQTHDSGISVIRGGVGTVIRGNKLSGNDVGIALTRAPLCCTVAANTLSNNLFFGELIRDGSNSVYGDTVSGGQVGVGVVAATANATVTLHNVSIKGTSVAPTKQFGRGSHVPTVVDRLRP